MRKFAIIIVLLLSPVYLLADTHFVSKSGSGEYPYTSWATAADSIQKGINASSPGDTVRVGSGTYRETIVMTAGITLLGAGFDSTVIYPYYRSVRDIVFGADSAVVEGFYIKGWQPGQMEPCCGIRSAIDSKLKMINNNKITNCDVGIYMDAVFTEVSNNIINNNDVGIHMFLSYTELIINNTIQQNNEGVYLLNAGAPILIKNIISDIADRPVFGDFLDSISIQNNLIVNVPGDIAVRLSKNSGTFVNAPIQNNTISANPWHAEISVNFSNEIKNNILMDGACGVHATRPNGYICNPQVSYNDIWNNVQHYLTANGATIDTSLGGNIYSDPMFVGGSDYHLQYGSPCIDAGDPGIKDPDSSRSDIGYYGGAYGETYTYLDYPPKPPDSLSAISESTVTILSWKPNTESDLSHYLVYKDTIAGFNPDTFKIVGNIPKDSSVFRDYDFVLGKNYFYRVSAWDLTGHQSEYSDELEVQATSVDRYTEDGPPLPKMFQLKQNSPNPFNPSTTIVYYLPDVGYQPAEVEIVIYNILGQRVITLVKERKYPGKHQVTWDGKDDAGNDMASGIYFYKMTFSGVDLYPLVKPKKMVLVR